MQRRALLKGLAVIVPTAGGAAAASAAYIRTKGGGLKDKGSEIGAALAGRIDELKTRFEASEERNRKLIRLAIGLAVLSLGLDINALL